jgi:phage protein D/phage baseplate assembly protein gpV
MGADTYAPDFDVRVEGLTLAADVRRSVLEVTYDNSLDTADMFEVRLSDPGAKLADSPLFGVGRTVEIHMGYGGRLRPMMLGEVAAVRPSFPASGVPTLTITGYDRSQRMRRNVPGRPPFLAMNDSLIAAQIALESRLIPIVDPSPLPPGDPEVFDGSDFALLQELAERNGFEVFVSFDKLYFRLPRPQFERPVLEWGRTLSSFDPRLSTASQVGIQVVRGYNEELAQAIVVALPALSLGGGIQELFERIGNEFLDMLPDLGRRVVNDLPISTPLDAATLAKSLLEQLLEGLYEGSGVCIGDPSLRAGDQVDIQGVGRRFSGSYRLRQVTHTISDGGYETRFEVSQKGHSSLVERLRRTLVDAPPPNKGKKDPGVVIGKVELNVDPKGLGRVLLSYPHLSDTNLSGWARVSSPSTGTFFLPDVGDEVLVAFNHGDLRRPVVLGTLWSAKAMPPAANLTPQNPMRSIGSPGGHKIVLDDTPGLGQVVVKSVSGSTITLSADGTVEIKATGKLVLKGVTVEVDADTDITMNAVNIKALVAGTMDVSERN